jgi:hypothetical protein
MTRRAAPSAAVAAAARMAAAAWTALAVGAVQAAGASSPAAQPLHAPSSLDAPASRAAAPAEAPYQDRVIETMGFDPAATIADETDPFDPEGLPRQLRIEGRGIQDRSTLVGSRSLAAFSIFGLIEKPNYGAISLDADLRYETGARTGFGYGGDTAAPRQRGTIAIRQRGMPLGDGMSLDNDLGFFAAPAPALARTLSRINLPAPRLQGAASQWFDERRRVTALAAAGQPMQFDGLAASRVQRLPGNVVQLGGQWDAEPEPAAIQGGDSRAGPYFDPRRRRSPWSSAVMFGQGRGLTSSGLYGATLTGAGAARFDARSAWLGMGGERRDLQWQAQMLSTRLDAGAAQGARTSRGGWADVQWRRDELAQGAGLYALDRSLSWLGLPLASDVTGGYWRGAWQTRRWTADGGVDLLRSPSTGKSGWFAVASMRQRLTSKLDWGTFGSMRNFNGRAHSLASDLQWRNGMGTTDLRAETTGDGDGGRAQRLTLQHDWDVEPGFALATSVSGGRARTGGGEPSLPAWAAAVSLEVPLKTTASVRGTVNTERNGDQTRHGFNAALVWPLSATWTFETGALLNRGQTRVAPPVDPLAPPAPSTATPTSQARSAYLALRYELRGGTPTAPFGGRPQDGGGTIEGRVFFDANRNGRLDAGEQGAPGVTVQLDGRWSVKTDSQGRYEFAWVAKGSRDVAVLDETLPLPWAAPTDAPRGAEVLLRQTVRRDIAVVSP